MAQIPPFQRPLDRNRDPDAWVGGARRKPTWRRANGQLDRAGFHALLRAAQLPLTELAHMGAEPGEAGILARKGQWVEESEAIMLLGRIVWDITYGSVGAVWESGAHQFQCAEHLGHTVVMEFFS